MNVPPVSSETTLTLPGNVSKLIFRCYLIKKKSLEVIEQAQLSLQTTKNQKSVEMSKACSLLALKMIDYEVGRGLDGREKP